jgi:hypothetical protein
MSFPWSRVLCLKVHEHMLDFVQAEARWEEGFRMFLVTSGFPFLLFVE